MVMWLHGFYLKNRTEQHELPSFLGVFWIFQGQLMTSDSLIFWPQMGLHRFPMVFSIG